MQQQQQLDINSVYDQYGEYIRRTIYSIVDKRYQGKLPALYPDFADIENECWVLITKQLQNFDATKASLKTFLVLIVKSQMNMLYKKDTNSKHIAMKTSTSLDLEQNDDEDCTLHSVLGDSIDILKTLENQLMVQDIYNCLTTEEVQYLQLHIVQKLPLKDVNKLLGWNVSVNSLNTKSSRLLKKIRSKVLTNLEATIHL